MLRFLLNRCHRPAIRFGLANDPSGRFRNGRFASFLAESNRNRMDTDFQDALLRGRKWMRLLFLLLLVGAAAWILVESARALTVF